MTTPDKSPGQIAYEADCAKRPNYHTGEPRKRWDQLSEPVQWSWEREPLPEFLGA